MRADLKAVADLVIQATRARLAPLTERIGELEAALKSLTPVGEPEVKELVQQAVDAMPKPRDGNDFPVEEVNRMVAAAVAALPTPKDGSDGVAPTAQELEPVIAEHVEKAVALIPAPKDGQSVPIDQVQKMIDEAVAKAVAAIERPKDGAPGRDALQIELQPAIDLEKDYPRGTYAMHDSGLWRAFEATKGMHGWECVVDGVADLRIEQATGRDFTLIARKSSGIEVSKTVKIAALIDKGIWRADTDYEAGDGVTWGGSFFTAQKDMPSGKPGEPGCDGWRLAVKRGRDAGKGITL